MEVTQVARLTVDGSSTPIDLNSAQNVDYLFNIQTHGTFDGATVTIEASLDGTNFSPVDNGDFTEPVVRTMRLRPCKIRATMSSAGTSDVYVKITK